MSQHVLAPLRALLWRRARTARKADAQRALWRGEVPLELDDASFRAWLAALPVTALVARPLATEGFVRGVTYASDARPWRQLRRPRPRGVAGRGALGRRERRARRELPGADGARVARAGGALPAGREALEGDAALARARWPPRATPARAPSRSRRAC
ncbi:MAG: hypothetical protein H6828_00980 [Planctomycetes bacterium]|nr:hypothetical protein [Planctomycetota bacterium]